MRGGEGGEGRGGEGRGGIYALHKKQSRKTQCWPKQVRGWTNAK